MADKKISELLAADPLQGDEIVPIVQNGFTKQVSVSLLAPPPAQSGPTNNFTATGLPDENNIIDYSPGSLWLNQNSGRLYIMIKVENNLGVWKEIDTHDYRTSQAGIGNSYLFGDNPDTIYQNYFTAWAAINETVVLDKIEHYFPKETYGEGTMTAEAFLAFEGRADNGTTGQIQVAEITNNGPVGIDASITSMTSALYTPLTSPVFPVIPGNKYKVRIKNLNGYWTSVRKMLLNVTFTFTPNV